MVDEDFVELEMDALNQHECMANIIAVIKHMQQKNITPQIPAVSLTCLSLLTDLSAAKFLFRGGDGGWSYLTGKESFPEFESYLLI